MNTSEEFPIEKCSVNSLWKLIANSSENVSIILPSGFIFNKNELGHIYDFYLLGHSLKFTVAPILQIIMAVFGIIGSAGILITLTHESYSQRIAFKSFMVALAVSDMMFNVFGIPFTIISTTSSSNGTQWAALPYMLLVTVGVINVSSLFCNLNSLCLTLTRYVMLVKPFYWKTRSNAWKRCFFMSCLILSLSMALLRLYLPLQYRVKVVNESSAGEKLYAFRRSAFDETPLYRVMGLACDIVLPLSISVLMLYLSIKIVFIVMRRRKILPSVGSTSLASCVTEIAVGHHMKVKHSSSINKLIFCTAAMTILCEVAYIYLWFLTFFLDQDSLSAEGCADVHLVRTKLRNYVLHLISAIVGNAVETFVRMCHFYNYMIFSSVFRNQFVEQIKCKN
ncbi:unnamed protein product [Soboliphyme baturini]|uniref:G_PROTEIN_RECEP_F1_2 domain-containing protein n=1 Tax=Soboliphyme baturini TaxID=241478 RepID=A0A183J858_9BILA|nr:unnamed protein product [Soboliphyme baturini]